VKVVVWGYLSLSVRAPACDEGWPNLRFGPQQGRADRLRKIASNSSVPNHLRLNFVAISNDPFSGPR